MSAARKAESLGSKSAAVLIDRLLNCKTQAEAGPIITSFLVAFGDERSGKSRAAAACGISVMLCDVLMTGLRNLPKVDPNELR